MSNIPKYLNKLRELNTEKIKLEAAVNNTASEIQELSKQIDEITKQWQGECTHPKEYNLNGECTACGYKEGELDESVSN